MAMSWAKVGWGEVLDALDLFEREVHATANSWRARLEEMDRPALEKHMLHAVEHPGEFVLPGLRVATLALIAPALLGSGAALGLAALTGLLLIAAALVQGPAWLPLRDTILGKPLASEAVFVGGSVEPGWEPVEKAFRANVEAGLERTAQFVVYHQGRRVVDLFGGLCKHQPYDGDSVQMAFSNSKSVAAIVVALAVERGYLDYSERVAAYWPEFAQNGKEDITLANVMRHEAGLAFFQEHIPVGLGARERLDQMADLIAKQPPLWERGGEQHKPHDRVYHAITRGLILNELVRRTDPAGRTIGDIIEEDISEPFGLPISLGRGSARFGDKFAHLSFDHPAFLLAKGLWDLVAGAGFRDTRERFKATFNPYSDYIRCLTCLSFADVDFSASDLHNRDEFHRLEYPSANLLASARSMAAIGNKMCQGELLSPDTQALALGGAKRKFDKALCCKTIMTQGGWCQFDGKEWDRSVHGFVGWGGFGGSVLAWDSARGLSVAKMVTGVQANTLIGFRDEARCLRLMRAVSECAEVA